jgi:hypothetical protein
MPEAPEKTRQLPREEKVSGTNGTGTFVTWVIKGDRRIYWVARGVRMRVKGRILAFVGGLLEPRPATGRRVDSSPRFWAIQSVHSWLP